MNYSSNELSDYDIKKWIRDLFGDTEIDFLDFEGNYDSMKLISNIISANKEAEKDAEETITAELHLINHYKQKSEKLSHSFSETFSLKDLPQNIAEKVEKISSVAARMKLKEPTITNFLLSSTALDNKSENHVEQEMINSYNLSKFSKKVTDVMQKNSILERNIDVLQKKVLKQQSINPDILEKSKFYRIKAEEYKKRNKKIEDNDGQDNDEIDKQLKCLGWKSSLSHSELVKRSETLQVLEHKVNNLTAKLESYQQLPPNEMLTQFKIEEAHTELLRLQNEFENLLKVLC